MVGSQNELVTKEVHVVLGDPKDDCETLFLDLVIIVLRWV